MSIKLIESSHPNKTALREYEKLVGIDSIKRDLFNHLLFFIDPKRFQAWEKKHFPNGLQNSAFGERLFSSPLFILAGEVGCGKTALAHSIASVVAKEIGTSILVMETPSNIRGTGLVGELSSRIAATFEIARTRVSKKNPGVLIIDEADDLATSRSQNQAHHEDRAGLNVLIKQIDQLRSGDVPLAVILVTNRLEVLDPAIVRRAELKLSFERPGRAGISAAFRSLLEGTKHSESDVKILTDSALKSKVPYSYSDLVVRVGKLALKDAIINDEPYGVKALMQALDQTEATPLLLQGKL